MPLKRWREMRPEDGGCRLPMRAIEMTTRRLLQDIARSVLLGTSSVQGYIQRESEHETQELMGFKGMAVKMANRHNQISHMPEQINVKRVEDINSWRLWLRDELSSVKQLQHQCTSTLRRRNFSAALTLQDFAFPEVIYQICGINTIMMMEWQVLFFKKSMKEHDTDLFRTHWPESTYQQALGTT
ncbi:hypothetical protein F2P81_025085 [Scophthalmus maximus]|uniref:Uncharacterized protein n=1 Tax=Scophthalmus maximus TaxID=52904 RepID=A0A6A4RLG2_SCOMX|nr:hypothetical protein F2P81_025085 [Scophthalmus maximus]